MPVNSRAKGANFEREIGNLLVKDLGLKNPVKSCLLYTSPSPRDLSTSRMPSSA